MKNLSALLERLSRSLNKDSVLKEGVIEAVFKETNIKLDQNKISLKNGVLQISASPVVNNEIKLKEERIKNGLREKNIFILRVLYK
jgi:hypothetical protein